MSEVCVLRMLYYKNLTIMWLNIVYQRPQANWMKRCDCYLSCWRVVEFDCSEPRIYSFWPENVLTTCFFSFFCSLEYNWWELDWLANISFIARLNYFIRKFNFKIKGFNIFNLYLNQLVHSILFLFSSHHKFIRNK